MMMMMVMTMTMTLIRRHTQIGWCRLRCMSLILTLIFVVHRRNSNAPALLREARPEFVSSRPDTCAGPPTFMNSSLEREIPPTQGKARRQAGSAVRLPCRCVHQDGFCFTISHIYFVLPGRRKGALVTNRALQDLAALRQ